MILRLLIAENNLEGDIMGRVWNLETEEDIQQMTHLDPQYCLETHIAGLKAETEGWADEIENMKGKLADMEGKVKKLATKLHEAEMNSDMMQKKIQLMDHDCIAMLMEYEYDMWQQE